MILGVTILKHFRVETERYHKVSEVYHKVSEAKIMTECILG